MRVYSKELFEKNFRRLCTRGNDPVSFRKAVRKAVSMLQSNKDLSKAFVVNRLGALGTGFYDCYVYSDVIMIYRITGQSIWLINIGTAEDLLGRK